MSKSTKNRLQGTTPSLGKDFPNPINSSNSPISAIEYSSKDDIRKKSKTNRNL